MNNGSSPNVVLVVGVFDLFHVGHLELLKRARNMGDSLIVAVNGDSFTRSYKRRPIVDEESRCSIVAACRYVDSAFVTNSADVKPILEQYAISTIVHGDDWEHESYMKQICVTEDYLRARGIMIKYTPYYRGDSTSTIIARAGQVSCGNTA